MKLIGKVVFALVLIEILVATDLLEIRHPTLLRYHHVCLQVVEQVKEVIAEAIHSASQA